MIETIFSKIELSDILTFQLTENRCVNVLTNIGYINGEKNICYQVAEFMKNEFHSPLGINISIEKQIPLAAGLGGGSSNAATTIRLLNDLWELNLSEERLHGIASEFGSDINFFLSQHNTALGTGRGEKIEPLPYFQWQHLLLVNPGIEITAREGYSLFDGVSVSKGYSQGVEYSLAEMINDLEPGVRRRYKTIDELLRKIENEGAERALMSGSGSTCIGFFKSKDRMQKAAELFEEMGYWTYQTKTKNGEKQCIQE
jgi:4-diphosphocytidyl-2-C-methyl-D-erythritol kinase